MTEQTIIRNGGGRNHSIDLLKILSMFMVVLLHSTRHGRLLDICEGVNCYTIFFRFVQSLSICSVDVFVLVSGYFLCTTPFKPSKIVRLWLQVFFYSVLWLVVTLFVLKEPVPVIGMLKAALPISYSAYWFISVYVTMLLLSPLINFLLRHLSRIQHIRCIILLVGIFSLWPDIMVQSHPTGINEVNYSSIWFVVLYLIASYIRLYPMKIKPCKAFALYSLTVFVLLGSWFVMSVIPVLRPLASYYFRYNSLVVLMSAVFLFLSIVNMEIKNTLLQRVISIFAPLTLGVYLIHDNDLVRNLVWQELWILQPTISALFVSLGYVVILFVACIAIDWVRAALFSIINKRTWYKAMLKKIDLLPQKVETYIFSWIEYKAIEK